MKKIFILLIIVICVIINFPIVAENNSNNRQLDFEIKQIDSIKDDDEPERNIQYIKQKVYNSKGKIVDTITIYRYWSRSDFIQDIILWADVYKIDDRINIAVTCAMACKESGYGYSGIYNHTNNCYGVKAFSSKWEGYVYSRNLGRIYCSVNDAIKAGSDREEMFKVFVDDKDENGEVIVGSAIKNSVINYMELIRDRYNNALYCDNDEEYTQAIVNGGYIIDDTYVDDILVIIANKGINYYIEQLLTR